ncbi:hypothetical protein CCYA_CCYA14G3795 [Cyanidiococcus yangmingshanensis]|nr:hypothetical protein CCYA_CCYA14G3795 [Cyanidiococcus yangmingshanensis]
MTKATDSLQIRLWTSLREPIYAAANGVEVSVPITFGRRNLECILKELLGAGKNESGRKDDSFDFDFIVLEAPPVIGSGVEKVRERPLHHGSLLRAPLGKFCERRGIPFEKVLHIEYFLRAPEPKQKILLPGLAEEANWIWSLTCFKRASPDLDSCAELVAYYGLQGRGGVLKLDPRTGDISSRFILDGIIPREQIRALAWCVNSEGKLSCSDCETGSGALSSEALKHSLTSNRLERRSSKRIRSERGSATEKSSCSFRAKSYEEHESLQRSERSKKKSEFGVEDMSISMKREQSCAFLKPTEHLVAGTLGGNIYLLSPCHEGVKYSPLMLSDAQQQGESAYGGGPQRAAIECIDVGADGRFVATGDASGNLSVLIWDLVSTSEHRQVEIGRGTVAHVSENMPSRAIVRSATALHGHALGCPVRSLRWWSPGHSGAHSICSASWDGSVRLWDVEKSICTFEASLPGTRPNALAVRKAVLTDHSSNDVFVAGCVDSSLRLIDPRGMSSGRLLGATLNGSHGGAVVSDVVWIERESEPNRQLGLHEWLTASVGYDGALRIWDWRCVSTGSKFHNKSSAMIWERLNAHGGKPILRTSTPGKNACLFTGGADGSVQQFSLAFR